MNLLIHHRGLIKATIPELQYEIMKDQLKKTLHDASRHVAIKNEEIIRTEDTLITKNFSQMTTQHKYSQDNCKAVLQSIQN